MARFRRGNKSVGKKVKKYVKRAINANIETKNISNNANIAAGAAGSSYAGTLYSLSQIAQGDNVNERTGNVIRPIRVRSTVSFTITAAAVQTQARVMLVRIKQQPTNTAPLVANILATTGSDMAPSSQYNSAAFNNNYFDVLKDKVVDLSVQGMPLKHVTFDVSRSVRKSVIHFTGAGAADYGKGNLYLLIISNQAAGGGASPYTNIATQTWYKDA